MHHDEITDFEFMLLQVEAINGCEATKAQVISILRANASKVIRLHYRALIKPQRIERAAQLLDAGNDRPKVRDALMARFGICRRAAYYYITQAIAVRCGKAKLSTAC